MVFISKSSLKLSASNPYDQGGGAQNIQGAVALFRPPPPNEIQAADPTGKGDKSSIKQGLKIRWNLSNPERL